MNSKLRAAHSLDKLEWIHSQIQEIQNGKNLIDVDLDLILEIVEDVRDDLPTTTTLPHKNLKVEVRGRFIYPICHTGKFLAEIASTKNLSKKTMWRANKLGYTFRDVNGIYTI